MRTRKAVMKRLLELKRERKEQRKILDHVSGPSEHEVQQRLDEIPIEMRTLKWVIDEQIGS